MWLRPALVADAEGFLLTPVRHIRHLFDVVCERVEALAVLEVTALTRAMPPLARIAPVRLKAHALAVVAQPIVVAVIRAALVRAVGDEVDMLAGPLFVTLTLPSHAGAVLRRGAVVEARVRHAVILRPPLVALAHSLDTISM